MPLDLTGQKFGRLTAIRPTAERMDHKVIWLFRCDCGKEKLIAGTSVKRGVTQSCGCLYSDAARYYFEGDRVGRLTIKSYVGKARYLCVCDCGNETTVSSTNFRKTQSCGCYRNELRTTHGMSKSRDFKRWHAMLTRCNKPSHESFKHYGGRGIKVCERWMKFENFMEDMGPAPAGLSIDRIDVNGDYEPSNCRWVDQKTQCQNKRPRLDVAIDSLTLEELELILILKRDQVALGRSK
jgi:hypothetical protein